MNQDIFFSSRKRARDYRKSALEKVKPYFAIALLVSLIALLLGAADGSFGFSLDWELSDEDIQYLRNNIDTERLLSQLQNGDFAGIKESVASLVGPHFSLIYTIAIIVTIAVFAFVLLFRIFVTPAVRVGYQRFFLSVNDGNTSEIRILTLFGRFGRGYLKTVGLGLLYNLILFATALPTLILSVVGGFYFLGSLASITSFLDALVLALASSLFALLGAAVSLAIRIPISYMYRYSYMIMAEYPELGVVDALRNSRNLMNGNKWRLFCLDFSYLGWYILAAVVTCCFGGVGVFLIHPWAETARTGFYHDISNRHAAFDTEFPSINPDDYQ